MTTETPRDPWPATPWRAGGRPPALADLAASDGGSWGVVPTAADREAARARRDGPPEAWPGWPWACLAGTGAEAQRGGPDDHLE